MSLSVAKLSTVVSAGHADCSGNVTRSVKNGKTNPISAVGGVSPMPASTSTSPARRNAWHIVRKCQVTRRSDVRSRSAKHNRVLVARGAQTEEFRARTTSDRHRRTGGVIRAPATSLRKDGLALTRYPVAGCREKLKGVTNSAKLISLWQPERKQGGAPPGGGRSPSPNEVARRIGRRPAAARRR